MELQISTFSINTYFLEQLSHCLVDDKSQKCEKMSIMCDFCKVTVCNLQSINTAVNRYLQVTCWVPEPVQDSDPYSYLFTFLPLCTFWICTLSYFVL